MRISLLSASQQDYWQELFKQTASAIRVALQGTNDWTAADGHPGQHVGDVIANDAALSVLEDAGVAILSEESGLHRRSDGAKGDNCVIVIDPVDGSTNAKQGISWYSASICLVLDGEPQVARVENLVNEQAFTAVRGEGAKLDGKPIAPSSVTNLNQAILGFSGHPKEHWGWQQYRSLGSSALDICLVAKGSLDGFMDCSAQDKGVQDQVAAGGHGPWDYLAAMLICEEAGAVVAEANHRDLVVLEHDARRYPIAAATPELLEELIDQLD